MATLPPSSDYTGSAITQGQKKAFMASVRSYLSTLLGDDGTAATARTALGIAGVPTGTVVPFAGATAPADFVLCYGQSLSTTTYAALFSVIGYAYGGSGVTFNAPDLRGRVTAGKDDMGGSAASRLTSGGAGIVGTTLGASGGTQTHTLTEAQLASHAHGAGSYAVTCSTSEGGTSSVPWLDGHSATPSAVAITGTSAAAGSSTAHQNTQPTLILNYIIKT